MKRITHTSRIGAGRQFLMAQVEPILLYGTFGLLMFGPLAFGAVEPWSIFVLEAGAVLLSFLWLWKQCMENQMTIHWNPLFAPMLAFAVLVVVQIVFKRSAYPHDTISEAILYCAYGMLCFVATQILRRGSQARKIAFILGTYGVAIAIFALLQGIAPNGKLYWLRVPELGGKIYGPYVNHNHYAGLMEMLVPIPLVTSLSRLVDEKMRIGAGVAAAIMVGTIFLSESRGGMFAIFLELAVLAAILFRQRRIARLGLGIGAFVVLVVSLLVWLGGKELSERVSSIPTETRGEISGGMRLSIDRDGIQMFRHRPVLGWGLGTFPVVYPQFRSFYTNFFVNEAHNDYVQLLSEMGVLGFGTMIWFLSILYRQALRKIGNWTREVSGAAALASSIGITGILFHSLVDFNLQIPANAAMFYVLCTVLASPPLLQRARKPRPQIPEEETCFPASEVV